MIKNGVPWDKVFGNYVPWENEMPLEWSYAIAVLFSEFSNPGQKYNWNSMKWEDKK